MKLGILGTGMIVKDMLTMFHQLNIEKAVLLGTKQTRQETQNLVETYHLDGWYEDYEELLKSDVDTIYVALPNHLHFSFAYQALQWGKHVIVEKPITANFHELQQLMTLAKEKDLILLEAMNIHYLPAYRSLKKDIEKIGALKVVQLNYSQYSSRYDAFQHGEILPAFDCHKAGGALMDINVYNLHAIVGMFGKPQNIRYFANVEKGIDTSGVLNLDYGTWKAVLIGAKDCSAPITSTYQGNLGTIVVKTPVNQMRQYTLIDRQKQASQKCFDEKQHRLYYEFEEFIRMITQGDRTKAAHMLEISATVSEIMETARKQEGVVFDND